MRLLLLLLTLALAVAGPAAAQDPAPDPDDVEQVQPVQRPGDDVVGGPDCDYTDADYAYERCCPSPGADTDYVYGADPDYTYACPSVAQPGGGGEPREERRNARPLPAGALPVTGSEIWLILLAGLGLLTTGSGLRLLTPHRN